MKRPVPTSEGVFRVEWGARGLISLEFPDGKKSAPQAIDSSVRSLQTELKEYFLGRRKTFTTPVDLSRGTEFQQKVWRAMQQIPFGKTKSYGEIARAIGSPNATRAVGSACGRNPIPILVPCHRVLAGGGKLGGFSSGLYWKKRLLAIEGITIFDQPARPPAAPGRTKVSPTSRKTIRSA